MSQSNLQPSATFFIFASILAAGLYELWRMDWSGVFVVVVALLGSLLPYVIYWRYQVIIPFVIRFGILAFLAATMVLGEVYQYYQEYQWWDTLLHGTSGVGITLIAFAMLSSTYQARNLRSSPLLFTTFAIAISLSIGVLWEIFEFIVDLTYDREVPMQPSNFDTMLDLCAAFVGTLLVALVAYLHETRRMKSTIMQNVLQKNS